MDRAVFSRATINSRPETIGFKAAMTARAEPAKIGCKAIETTAIYAAAVTENFSRETENFSRETNVFNRVDDLPRKAKVSSPGNRIADHASYRICK